MFAHLTLPTQHVEETTRFLEKVLGRRDDPRREPLVWQNFNFGSRRRKRVRMPTNSNSINPTHTLHPEHFDMLSQYVKLPK